MNFKPGDLVMVVKPTLCCGHESGMGKLYTVTKWTGLGQKCTYCGRCDDDASRFVALDGKYNCEPERLRLIPPLSDLETIDTRDEVTA